jgi:hypothetical protein
MEKIVDLLNPKLEIQALWEGKAVNIPVVYSRLIWRSSVYNTNDISYGKPKYSKRSP